MAADRLLTMTAGRVTMLVYLVMMLGCMYAVAILDRLISGKFARQAIVVDEAIAQCKRRREHTNSSHTTKHAELSKAIALLKVTQSETKSAADGCWPTQRRRRAAARSLRRLRCHAGEQFLVRLGNTVTLSKAVLCMQGLNKQFKPKCLVTSCYKAVNKSCMKFSPNNAHWLIMCPSSSHGLNHII